MQNELIVSTMFVQNQLADVGNYLGPAIVLSMLILFLFILRWISKKDTQDAAQGKPARFNLEGVPSAYPCETRGEDHRFDEKGWCIKCGLKALVLDIGDYNVEELIEKARREDFVMEQADGSEIFKIVFKGEFGHVWYFTEAALYKHFWSKESDAPQ